MNKSLVFKVVTLFLISAISFYSCGNDDEPQEPTVDPNAIIEFTDPNFKAALLEHGKTIISIKRDIDIIDTNNDGEIQVTEAETYSKSIYCSSLNISNIEGIKYFKQVTELILENNNISTIDVSNNLDLTLLSLNQNKLTQLDISNNKKLTYLNVSENELTQIDVTKNTNLISLYVSNNNLTQINTSQNVVLSNLGIQSNQINLLNLSNNLDLKELHCYSNKITELDLTSNNKIKEVICSDNELTSLNLANGNNNNIVRMLATNNPNLTCIGIDTGFNIPAGGWVKDDTADYSDNCQ